MELSNLIFKVDTSQLEKAVKTIEQVGQATEGLAKNIQNLARAEKQAADASTASAKARQENAKATTAEIKAAEAQANAAEKAARATRDLGKSAEETGSKLSAAEKLVEKMNLRQQVLARGTIELNNEVVNLGRGFTSGQAAMIASLKQLGGGADMIRELATTLKQYNDITGVNPFDKAIGGMRKLTQEARELQLSSDLSAKGFALTKDQVQILARDLQALTSVYKQNGASQEYVNRAIDVVTKRFIRKAEVVNRLNAEVKENERAAKAQGNAAINAAKATSFIERELARAENALQGLNEQLYVSTSNRLLKFQQSLAASNLPMEQQIALMERYKKTLAETDAQRRKQNTADSNRQVDLLARSLAPQISDVAVSLAGGMNPFTVLMQQGLQVRDLMQLSGVEAERMGEAFRKAGSGMVSTSVAAAGAIGSMLGGAILDAGKSVVDFGLKIFGLRKPFNELTLAMAIVGDTTENQFVKSTVDAWLAVSKFIPLLAGLAVVLAGAGIASVLGATIAVAREQSALSKALATTGASLGLTKNQAVDLAASLNGITASKGVETLTEMAKAGGFTQEQFGKVAEAASKMSKFVGQDVATTVAQFKDLQKDPAEALAKLAAGNGLVEISVIKKVKQLQEDKKIQEAINLATEAHAAALVEVAGIVESEMHPMTALWIDLKSAVNSVWEEIKALAATDVVMNTVRGAFDTVRGVVYDLWMVVKAVGKGIGGLGAIAAAVISGDFSGAKSIASSMMDDVQRGLEDRETYMKGLYDFERKADKQLNTDRKKNAQDAEKFIRDLKKSPKSSREKSSQEKSEEAAYKNYLKFVRDMKVQAVEAGTAQGTLTKAQEDMIKLLASDHWKNLSENNKQSALSYFYIANAAQEAQRSIEKAAEAAKQAAKEAFESDAKRLDAAADYEASLRDSLNAIQDESVELQFQAGLIGLVDSERKKAIESRKIEIEYAKELKRIEALDGEFVDKDALKASALQKRNLQLKNLNTSIANDLNQKMVDGVTEAIMTGLIEGGEAGKKKLRDLIVAELQKPVKMFIQATVSNIFGLNGGQQGGGVNWLEMAGKAWDWFSGGSTAAAAGTITNGMSQSAMLAAQTAGMEAGVAAGTSAGTAAGTAAAAVPVVGWIAAAIMVAESMYKKGYNRTALGVGEGEKKTYGRFSSTSGRTDLQQSAHYKYSAENAARGLLDGLGLSKKWADIFSGTVRMAHLFGRRLKGYGYQADVRGSDVNVSGYEYYKGGVFRSNKTVTTAVDSRDAENLKQQIESVRSASKGMAMALGGSTEAIDAFSGSVKINFKGAEAAAEQQARLADGLLQLELEMINAATGANMTKESLMALKQEAANLAQQAGYSSEQLGSMIRDGMLGRISGDELGGMIGDYLLDSIYNALAQGFANQITGVITDLIISPLMTAVLTGGNLAQVVNATTIAAVRKQATDTINAFRELLADPSIQALFSDIANLSSELGRIISSASKSVTRKTSSMRISRVTGTGASGGSNEADRITNERKSLERKILELQGNTVEIRRLELEELHPSNRELQKRVWFLEDEQRIAQEREGLEQQIFEVLGKTAILREQELKALDPSNRALQMHIYALEDAKNAYDGVVDAVNDTLDKSKELKDRIKGIFDLLLEQIRELRGEVKVPAEMQRAEAQRFLQGVISSGVLPDQEELGTAIDALRSGIVDNNFKSEVEAARERLALANTLDQIKTLADQDLKKIEQDILLLEQQLTVAQDQMNALLGIQTYTYNTEQAVIALQGVIGNYTQAFNSALNAVVNAMNSAPTPTPVPPPAPAPVPQPVHVPTPPPVYVPAPAPVYVPVSSGGGGGGAKPAPKPVAKQWTPQGYWDKNPDLQQYWAANGKLLNEGRGWSRDDYLRWHWQNYGSKPSEARQFAKGGAFTNGIVQSPTRFNIGEMGEAGPEAIMPLVNVGGSLGVRAVSGDSDTSKQLEMLSTAVMQLTIATNKMQRQFDNARGEDGTSLNVTIVNTSSNPVLTDAV